MGLRLGCNAFLGAIAWRSALHQVWHDLTTPCACSNTLCVLRVKVFFALACYRNLSWESGAVGGTLAHAFVLAE